MARIKITGYYTPGGNELDTEHTTGLTQDAYAELVEGADALTIGQLSGLEITLEAESA